MADDSTGGTELHRLCDNLRACERVALQVRAYFEVEHVYLSDLRPAALLARVRAAVEALGYDGYEDLQGPRRTWKGGLRMV